jgi:hypothetical protein
MILNAFVFIYIYKEGEGILSGHTYADCHDEEHTKFEHFVRCGSTKGAEVKPATYNPFAELKVKMEATD